MITGQAASDREGIVVTFILCSVVLVAVSILLLMCVLLVLEVLAGTRLLSHGRHATAETVSDDIDLLRRTVILVPAHNEAVIIGETVYELSPAMAAGASILVVADNCTDETARLAASAGAQVVERRDAAKRGKGFALEYGIAHLGEQPPETVVVVDADCRMSLESLRRVVALSRETGRPVQARYHMELQAAAKAGSRQRLSALAWRLKADIRQAGLQALFGVCHLSGSGMAFPWPVIAKMPLGTGAIVEDLVLGLWLAREGHGARFARDAATESVFPMGEAAGRDQRRRWESGHLHAIATEVPTTLFRGMRQRRVEAVALALDAAVPPLSFLAIVFVALTAVSLIVALVTEFWLPFALSGLAGLLVLAALVVAIRSEDRGRIRVRDVLDLASYVGSKIGIYAGALTGRSEGWVKTRRDQGKK